SPDKTVRNKAIYQLGALAARVDRTGLAREQRGGEKSPQVPGLVGYLIQAAHDPENRCAALTVLADTCDPQAAAEIRRHLKDTSAQIRLHAACLLTEFQDTSGLKEMKQALARWHSEDLEQAGLEFYFNIDLVIASLERITGKSFGKPPLMPLASSDSGAIQAAAPKYRALL